MPVIALIRYLPLYTAGLTDLTAPRDFNHFLLVVGVSARYVTVHDTYNINGAYKNVPIDVFKECWSTVLPPNMILKMTIPLGKIFPVGPYKRMINNCGDYLRYRTGPGLTYSIIGALPPTNAVYSVSEIVVSKDTPPQSWAHLVEPAGYSAAWLMKEVL